MNEKLISLNFKQLVAVLAACNHGSIGFDAYRDPRTNRKASLVDFIVANNDADTIVKAIAAVTGEPAPKVAEPDPSKIKISEPAPAGKSAAVKAHAEVLGVPAVDVGKDAKIDRIAKVLGDLLATSLDEDRVKELVSEGTAELTEQTRLNGEVLLDCMNAINLVAEEVKNVQQRPVIHVAIKDRPEAVVVDGQHPMFTKVLCLAAAGLNVMLKGPSGCGKTHMAEQIAKVLGRKFGAISGSAGASESQLIGRLLPTGEAGRFEYHASPFVTIYESKGEKDGGLFLFDEMDAFDPNMVLTVNTATANGHFTVEARSSCPWVIKHPTSILLAAVNTFGTGPDALHVGRNQLDGATLDRWYIVEMDYDSGFEAGLFGGAYKAAKAWQPAPAPTPQELCALGEWVTALRAKANTAKLRRICSTRMIQKAIAARSAGVPTEEVKRDLLAGWSRDELAKVGL